ncbi:sulfotransferase domain-containing protein [Thermocoleostomius sinensis]|jgi:hypothetical protein|uniref:Sulfotransferase domain-containing protein n=1 Tax=Thermocoleostomius sinensis A174 TaxID=2016057 RepID=A0A9E9C6Y4_9CYAN|nr:sulfotransferase domain-containing protein [Thermocoleostomius sinensis]WAL62761.1 sulfotransferase domain-containing protein [Thermocoleostomius sinensis A174]
MPGLVKWNDIVSVQALCGIMNTPAHIRWKIGSAPNHAIVRSHLMHCNVILNILKEFDSKILFIYRDLRDVAVSHARWVMKEERIFLHKVYKQQKDFDDHLMSSILGVPVGSPFGSNVSQPDIGQDFARWKGWIYEPTALAVKFEDLVGERGESSEEIRLQTIEKIANFLELNLTPQQIDKRFSSHMMNPAESHTFVKGGQGRRGGWRAKFNPQHKEAFKRVAGDVLIELGYEQDMNW